MQQLILNIDENRYQVLLKFLSTLDYVRIVKPAAEKPTPKTAQPPAANQLALLKQALQQQTQPLFQQIADPAEWQKQQRDEWS
jgi:hypothetical protein